MFLLTNVQSWELRQFWSRSNTREWMKGLRCGFVLTGLDLSEHVQDLMNELERNMFKESSCNIRESVHSLMDRSEGKLRIAM